MAAAIAMTLAACARPGDLLAGRKAGLHVAGVVVALVAALLATWGSGVLLAGEVALIQAPPLQLRLVFLLVGPALAGMAFVAAHRTQNETTVYAGILALGLATLTVRAALPELFGSGFFRVAWPYVSIAGGFAASIVAAKLETSGATVFVRPFNRLGAILPVLPLFLLWFIPPRDPGAIRDHMEMRALALAAVAAYMIAAGALSRRPLSVAIGLVAANLALFTLWLLLGWDWLSSPQLFAIPVGMTMVLVARIEREALGEARAHGLAFAGLLVIYASGTWKLFEVGEWHSIGLAVLALLGILAGLATKQRRVTVTGGVFLGLVVITELFRTAREHPWLWWAFGVGVGVALLAFVGWNESRKKKTGDTG